MNAEIISIAIFLGLAAILMLAFSKFDKLVKIEYKKYRDDWRKDGRPYGFFWKPPESTWFSSSIAMQRLSMRWLFKTPHWIAIDADAKFLLKKLRLYVFLFYIGMIMWVIFTFVMNA